MKKPKQQPLKNKPNHLISVQYALESTRGIPAAVSLRQWVNATLSETTEDICELTIRITTEQEIAELNERFRNKTGSTNVLSFPAPDIPEFMLPTTHARLIGDVIICAAVAQKESQLQQKSLRVHMAHLVVHGVLHLQGYDHQLATDAEAMEDLERKILQQLDIPDPYLIIEKVARI